MSEMDELKAAPCCKGGSDCWCWMKEDSRFAALVKALEGMRQEYADAWKHRDDIGWREMPACKVLAAAECAGLLSEGQPSDLTARPGAADEQETGA